MSCVNHAYQKDVGVKPRFAKGNKLSRVDQGQAMTFALTKVNRKKRKEAGNT